VADLDSPDDALHIAFWKSDSHGIPTIYQKYHSNILIIRAIRLGLQSQGLTKVNTPKYLMIRFYS
jgi:hypothetical protein